MELKFEVQGRIAKPVDEVFDAVYNPDKLSGYFTTGGASGPLDEGVTVTWDFADSRSVSRPRPKGGPRASDSSGMGRGR